MKNNFFITILLALLFGLLAGLFGQIIGRYYISEDLTNFSLSREFDLIEGRSNLIIRDPRKVVVSQDAKIVETQEMINQSLYKLFDLSLIEEDYLNLNEALSLALAISNDGWLISVWPNDLNLKTEEEFIVDLRLVGPNRLIYELESIVIKEIDNIQLLFIKANNLNRAVVRDIVLCPEMKAGLTLLAFKNNNQLSLASLVDKGVGKGFLSSDKFNRNLAISAPDYFLSNSLVFNLAGDFVGLTNNNQDFYPAPLLAVYWQSLLINQEISTPFFGIHYLNLTNLKFLDNNLSRGALIIGDENYPAIISNSPADLAGLEEGDIITQVNGQSLNENLDLSTIILSLKAGDQISLTYIREQSENQINITLGKYEKN